MKKRIGKQGKNAALLALAGAILLSGCAGASTQTESEQPETAADEASTTIETEEPVPATQETETATQETQPAENDTSVTSGELPEISISYDSREWYADDQETLLLSESTCAVSVTNEGFDNLAAALDNWSAERALQDEPELLDAAREHYSMSVADDLFFTNYSSEVGITIERIDAKVLSMVENGYDYTGGAHGMYGAWGYTYDVSSGEELTLADILADKEGFYDAATEYIINALDEEYSDGLWPNYEEIVSDNWTSETGANYFLDGAGIVIIYTPYELGPYAMGMPEVTLPYGTFGEYLMPEYQPTGALIAIVAEGEDISALTESASPVYIEEIEGDSEFGGLTLISGVESEEISEYGWFAGAYALKYDDGKILLFVCARFEDDIHTTFVYELTGGRIKSCDTLDNAALEDVSLDSITVSQHLDVLGTYSGTMRYAIEDDGTLAQSEEIFAIDAYCDMAVIKELPVTIDGADATLPAGSRIKITGTDNAGTAYFETDDGQEGSIHYTMDDDSWTHYIDGVSEYEYFEMIPYAG